MEIVFQRELWGSVSMCDSLTFRYHQNIFCNLQEKAEKKNINIIKSKYIIRKTVFESIFEVVVRQYIKFSK